MTIKQICVIPALLLITMASLAMDSAALSRRKQLFEQVDESTLVVVGIVSDSRTLFEASADGRRLSQLGRIYKITVEKVIKGEGIPKEILIVEKLPSTLESALYLEGDRVLLFLNDITVAPELVAKTKELKGDELALLKQPRHYAPVSGKQGYLYLGLDAKLLGEYQVSKKEYHKRRLSADSKMGDEKTRNHKYLQSTEEFVRITNIKDTEERDRAWKKVLDGGDDVLKESARVKLKKASK